MPVNNSTKGTDSVSTESIEEGYWSALLEEGEFARSTASEEVHHTTNERQKSAENQHESPQAILSIDENDWDNIEQIQERDESLLLVITGYNRGGLLVEWNSLRGFIPASQLIHFPTSDNYYERRTALSDRVGKSLSLRVIELDRVKNRLIFSERAAQVESGKRGEILQELSPGSTPSGKITNLCEFGAFVDLGGIEGLIHISELSWGRVAHPSDMLKSGQIVKVYVLDVDENEARIALSLKRLCDDPWITVQSRYRVGEVVEGRITNVVDFGAFACIEEGLEGLIHFSELAEGQFLHPRNVVAEDDIIKARILSIDGKARRLGLSLRLV